MEPPRGSRAECGTAIPAQRHHELRLLQLRRMETADHGRNRMQRQDARRSHRDQCPRVKTTKERMNFEVFVLFSASSHFQQPPQANHIGRHEIEFSPMKSDLHFDTQQTETLLPGVFVPFQRSLKTVGEADVVEGELTNE